MADIILKDGTGTPQTFEDVASITVPKSGGGTAKFSAVSGNIHITQNGAGIDVSSYETASVSVSAGGGSNIDFGVNVGDSLDTVYFNTKHDTFALDASLTNAPYPNTAELAGITMPWNNAIVGTTETNSLYVHIGNLSSMQPGTYIIYIMQSETPTVLYSTKALDASAVIPGMVLTPGWQVSKLTIGATITISAILDDFLAIKDNYFARTPQAYGEWGSLNLQAKSLMLGEILPEIITPDSDYNALSSVTVSINDSIIKPANIRSGITILGIRGNLEGLAGGQWYLSHSDTDNGDGYYTVLEVITTATNIKFGSTAMIFASKLKSWYDKYSNGGTLIIVHSSAGHKVGDKFDPFNNGWTT